MAGDSGWRQGERVAQLLQAVHIAPLDSRRIERVEGVSPEVRVRAVVTEHVIHGACDTRSM